MAAAKLKIIRDLLSKLIKDIDDNKCDLPDDKYSFIIDSINGIIYKPPFNRLMMSERLGISVSTFDNYVREGKLSKGKKQVGIKELSWNEDETVEEFNKIKIPFHLR